MEASGEVLIPKNGRETLRLALDSYRGHQLVSLRVWFPPTDGGPLRPGREGFAVNVALLPDLIQGLIDLQTEARKRGLLATTHDNEDAGIACECCGRQFKPARRDARYCSAGCRQRAKRDKADTRSVTENPAICDEAGNNRDGAA